MKNGFFHLSDIPGSENGFSQVKRFSFRLVETNFLSSRNSIVLFRALLENLKFEGSSFLGETLFLLVETDFLASRS